MGPSPKPSVHLHFITRSHCDKIPIIVSSLLSPSGKQPQRPKRRETVNSLLFVSYVVVWIQIILTEGEEDKTLDLFS